MERDEPGASRGRHAEPIRVYIQLVLVLRGFTEPPCSDLPVPAHTGGRAGEIADRPGFLGGLADEHVR
jgi:hypothetical protein